MGLARRDDGRDFFACKVGESLMTTTKKGDGRIELSPPSFHIDSSNSSMRRSARPEAPKTSSLRYSRVAPSVVTTSFFSPRSPTREAGNT